MDLDKLRNELLTVAESHIKRPVPVGEARWKEGSALLVDGTFLLTTADQRVSMFRRVELPDPDGINVDYFPVGKYPASEAAASVLTEIVRAETQAAEELERMARDMAVDA